MNYKVKKQNIFKTPVWTTRIDADNKKIQDYAYSLKSQDKSGVIRSNVGGWHSNSHPGNFHGGIGEVPEILGNLFDSFCELIKNNITNGEEVVIDNWWFNINHKKVLNTHHSHPGADYSLVYYVKTHEDCGDLVLKRSDDKVLFNREFVHHYEMENPDCSIKPEDGQLVIFPSWLKHSVDMNAKDKDRISLAVNFVLKKRLNPDNKLQRDGYQIVRNFLSKDLLELTKQYFDLKIENDELILDDGQVPGTFTAYGTYIGDSILKMLQPVAESVIGEELYPCYTFFRLYNRMDWLKPHTDRPSCEFSATIPIFTDKPWPLYLQEYDFEKYGTEGLNTIDGKSLGNFKSTVNEKSTNLTLELGDVCFYEGTKMNHWREPFEGNECYQLFIHYVRKNGKYSEFKFDKRPNLGFEAGSQKSEWSIDNFL